jgi:hypothetical protein
LPLTGFLPSRRAIMSKNKPLTKSNILTAITDAVGEEVSKKHVKEIV